MHTIQGVASDAYHVQRTRTFRVWFSTDVDCLGRHSSSKQECQDSSSPLHLSPLSDEGVLVFPETEDCFLEKALSTQSCLFYQGHRTVVCLRDLPHAT